jgi:hypothetical protein
MYGCQRTQILARIGLVFLVVAPCTQAQDTHYWNLFYGTQASLLSGAVIGSASDLSATYYNPGMLAVNREQGIVLGASVYQYQHLNLEGAQEKAVTSSRVGVTPGLLAGRFPVDSGVVGGIAYSVLTRQYMNIDLHRETTGERDILDNDGIPDQISRYGLITPYLSETWVGVTAFRLIGPNVGIGLTNYVAVRTQQNRTTLLGEARSSNGSVTAATDVRTYDYYNVRLLWKFGIGVALDRLTLGMTVTTPSVNLFGTGSAFESITYSNPGGVAGQDVLIADYQEEVSSRYYTSWAIGAGFGYRMGNVRFHLSAEWYAPVSRFDVLATTSFVGQSDGIVRQNRIDSELRSVLDGGIGVEYTLSPAATFYASVVTDYSASPPGTTTNLAIATWDLLHITGGAILKLGLFDLTLGISGAGGSKKAKDLTAGGGVSNLVESFADATVHYLSLTGLLAFTFKL